MDKKIELRKVRDFGEIINDTFTFIQQNWKALLKTYAVICGFFVVASLIVSIFNQIKMADHLNTLTANSRMFRLFGVEYVLAMVFALLSYTAINLSTFAFVALYVEKGNIAPTVEEVWSYFKFYFFRVIGSALLLGLGLCIGFVMCLIPGFYLWPAFTLIIPIIVFENATLGYGFNRAFQLIKNNYWPTLGTILITIIIVYVAMAIVVLPVTIITTGSMVITGHKLNSTYLILNSILAHICQVFLIMPAIAVSFIYFSLTEQKDGTGLMERINNLGNTDQASNQLPSEEY